MNRSRTYALAFALGITSFGALSSNAVSSNGLVDVQKYADAFASASEGAMRYISTSIDSVFPPAERSVTHVRASTTVQEDANILGTVLVVTFIAGFAIVRRLG